MKLELYATVFGYTNVYDENKNLLYKKLRVSFDDEYNEKRDSPPIRELRIREDKFGKYVIHNHKRYYYRSDTNDI